MIPVEVQWSCKAHIMMYYKAHHDVRQILHVPQHLFCPIQFGLHTLQPFDKCIDLLRLIWRIPLREERSKHDCKKKNRKHGSTPVYLVAASGHCDEASHERLFFFNHIVRRKLPTVLVMWSTHQTCSNCYTANVVNMCFTSRFFLWMLFDFECYWVWHHIYAFCLDRFS